MIPRKAQYETIQLLEEFPAIAVLGPRQVGKTTLAETIGHTLSSEPIYLDLAPLLTEHMPLKSNVRWHPHYPKDFI